MKKQFFVVIVCLLLIPATFAWAESPIPNLVGTWESHGEAGMFLKGKKASAMTHPQKETGTVDLEVVIQKQKGRVLHGFLKGQNIKERLVGVIGFDNKSIHAADEDGFINGKIINKDRLEMIYLHAKISDSVAAAAIWTRKK